MEFHDQFLLIRSASENQDDLDDDIGERVETRDTSYESCPTLSPTSPNLKRNNSSNHLRKIRNRLVGAKDSPHSKSTSSIRTAGRKRSKEEIFESLDESKQALRLKLKKHQSITKLANLLRGSVKISNNVKKDGNPVAEVLNPSIDSASSSWSMSSENPLFRRPTLKVSEASES